MQNYKTPKEVVHQFDVSETCIYHWCQSGYLPSYKVESCWWIDPDVELESLSNPMNEKVRSEMKSRGWWVDTNNNGFGFRFDILSRGGFVVLNWLPLSRDSHVRSWRVGLCWDLGIANDLKGEKTDYRVFNQVSLDYSEPPEHYCFTQYLSYFIWVASTYIPSNELVSPLVEKKFILIYVIFIK